MELKMFYGNDNKLSVSNNKAAMEFIRYYREHNLKSEEIISFTPTISNDMFGYNTTLWVLIDR